jgi:hypothetical protein
MNTTITAPYELNVALADGVTDGMWSHAPIYARIDQGNLHIHYRSIDHPPVKVYADGEWQAFYVRKSA